MNLELDNAKPATGAQALDGMPPIAIAKVGSKKRNLFPWVIVLLSVGISIGLFTYSRLETGDVIEIEFNDGYGLKEEDRVRHLGIEIGYVEKVQLTGDLKRVVATVRLSKSARAIAREGTQFWIVRPTVSMTSVAGLDTILGAKYIEVHPGPFTGNVQKKFVGLNSPPVPIPKEGSLEVVLDGGTRGGLSVGAPILYRGYRVGTIMSVGLASDARSVQARCSIDPEYRDLIRVNTHFWNRSGWKLQVGISGIRIDADSMAQIMMGGIEMGTPDELAPPVSTGHRFVLFAEADPEWTQWKPSIAHGELWNRIEDRLPMPQRIVVRWQERRYGFRTNRQLSGWCLPLTDGTLLCLEDFVAPPENALSNSVSIEIAGISIAPNTLEWQHWGAQQDKKPRIVKAKVAFPIDSRVNFFPIDRVENAVRNTPAVTSARDLSETNVAICRDDPSASILIDASRITRGDSYWEIDPSISIADDLLGSPVVATISNKVIGVLMTEQNKGTIVLIP